MTELDLYRQYLVATQIKDRLRQVGLSPAYVMVSQDHSRGSASGLSVDSRIAYEDARGTYLFDKDREDKMNRFLELFPDVTVTRENPYGKPDMLARWDSSGVSVEVNFGTGVCEQRQVGTQKVMSYDPAALANVPKIEVEQPIFEYFCPDPILG